MSSRRILLHILSLTALTAAAALAFAGPAVAKSYGDVPKGHWAYTAISSVTNRTVDGHRLLDDYKSLFRPERPITRELLARSIVLASGHYGEKITPAAITDVPKGYRYYSVIQMAVKQGYMSADKAGAFRPTETVTAAGAETVMIRWLKERYSSYSWSLLTTLDPRRWKPNPGWSTGAPSYLAAIVASRQLELRFNHPTGDDDHEALPSEPIDRAEIAYMLDRAFKVGSSWQLYGLASFADITLPTLSDRQRQITRFALKWVGYPYIWAGEYPTPNSPYGTQKAGGFDCSGFVFYVMKMHFAYPITVNERGAHDMAARANPRVTRAKLKCGDLIFFGPKGPKSSIESIYHAGLYLGNGWFIHSTGSSDGVTMASLNDSSYWKAAFAWGRRVLTDAELVIPSPSPLPSGPPAPAAAPPIDGFASPAPEALATPTTATATPSASPAPAQP